MTTRHVLIVLLLAGVCLCSAEDIVRLKRGSTYRGTVTNLTEDTLSIVTSVGRLTFRWDVLDVKTIQQFNPEMFEELRAAELHRKEQIVKDRGFVKYKGTWYPPEKAKELEMKDNGFELYEDEWKPTNEVAEIKFREQMESRGMKEHKGKWYTEEELEVVLETETNRGLKIGAKTDEVIAQWGEPTRRVKSAEFASREREMWIYTNEEKQREDRVVFEYGAVKSVMIDQALSE
jgi:hypothetical protein